jgi:hypothetical protein
MGVLRLLVVEGGAPAPVCTDICEDWVRAPITDADLRVRVATLQAKAEAYRLPQVDPYGILRFADRSITVSPSETDLLECLIRQFGVVVPRPTLQECLPDRPGGASRNALDLHIMRGRGYLLETEDCHQVLDQRRPRPRPQLAPHNNGYPIPYQPARPPQPQQTAKVTPLRPRSRQGLAI